PDRQSHPARPRARRAFSPAPPWRGALLSRGRQDARRRARGGGRADRAQGALRRVVECHRTLDDGRMSFLDNWHDYWSPREAIDTSPRVSDEVKYTTCYMC